MAAASVELTLPAFKSLRAARVPLRPLTLLVGRNRSGDGLKDVPDCFEVVGQVPLGMAAARDLLRPTERPAGAGR